MITLSYIIMKPDLYSIRYCQVPVFFRFSTENRSVFRSTETQRCEIKVFFTVRKRSGQIRKIEKTKKEFTSAPAVVLTSSHHDQGPCPIELRRVEYRLAEEGEKRC